MKIPQGFTQLTPYLAVEEPIEYIEFLKNAFEAIEIGRSHRPDGNIANCQVKIGDAILMIASSGGGLAPSKSYIYIFVEDAHAAFSKAISHGAHVFMEVFEMPYGDLQGGVEDMAGNIWWISQRLVDEPYF